MSPLDRAARALLAVELAQNDDAIPHDAALAASSFHSEGPAMIRARETIRAVLAALAEPSPEMVEAGVIELVPVIESPTSDGLNETSARVWRAMLAKAGE